jgi:hypothetical protein
MKNKMTKIKLLVFALGAIVFLNSCGGSGKENPSETKSDSLVINNKQLEKSVGSFKEGAFPFTVDTTFLFKIEEGDSLGESEVRLLAKNIFKNPLTASTESNLGIFYKIDSIKAAGKYQEYCDSLQIGETKICTAHALKELHLDANTLILVWRIYTSSYEACPSSLINDVYFTIIYKGDVVETFTLGEYAVFADPPVASQTITSSVLLKDGTLNLSVQEINDQDMDSAKVEVTKSEYSFNIIEGRIKEGIKKVGDAKMVDRKKVGF